MSDIVSKRDEKDWLVVGWFTPDYRPLAENFSLQLYERKAPFHLFAKPSVGYWTCRRKPTVVLEAMGLYPGKTIVLMDVDCVVSGDIEPITSIKGDVGLAFGARRRRRSPRKILIAASSRVVVFKPTFSARTFAEEWERQAELCAPKGIDEEGALGWTLLGSTLARHSHLDPLYAGFEIGKEACEEAVIAHTKTHMPKRTNLLKALRRVERLVRAALLSRPKYHQPTKGFAG